jgi:glycosyltransferase involved in cell wall biosynthesis
MHVVSERVLTVVLVLDHAFVSGGQAKVAFDSAVGLKQAGHQPIVFAAVGPVDPALDAAGIPVVCLDQSDLVGNPSPVRAAIQGIWNKPAMEALARLLAGLPPDSTVVHVHGWAKALSPSIAKAIAASGLPAVYTMHEYFLMCPNGGFYNYPQQRVCHLRPLSGACWATDCDSRSYSRKIWRNVRSTVMEKVAHLPAVFSDIICFSPFQVDAVGSMLPPAATIHLVSNPIAAVNLGPKVAPATGEIVFIGRISPEKGPLLYAEAARKLGLAPVFIGDGPLRDEIRSRYPQARMLGWQNHDAVRTHLREARALVFPSLWYEGQPLTVLESLSVGTPVLVSDDCAGRDSVVDGVSGLWFRSGDADDLARAMAEVADDGVAARLSQGAYEGYWADPPTLDRHVRALLDIYGRLVTSEPNLLAPEGEAVRAA